jgi:chromate transporter
VPRNSRPSIVHLFLSFLRLGVTAFGGPAMVIYIRRMAVDKKHWLDAHAFADGVALAQMVPGATAMQTAAYVGLKARGVIGAGASYIGFGLPAFLLMMTFAAFYAHTWTLPAVASAFSGLQAIIVAVVGNATLAFGKTTLKGWKAGVIAGVAAVLFALRVSPILVISLAAVEGLVLIRPKRSTPDSSCSSAQPHPYRMPLMLILAVSAIGLLALFLLDRPMFSLAVLLSKIDLLAFGGGFASVPLMLHEIVEVRNWIDGHTFMNGIILGQITPGPIVITATFIGYLMGGPVGGMIATIGILLPSFVVIVGLSPYFGRLRASASFNGIVNGVLCSFVGLLLTVTIRFASDVRWEWGHLVLAGGALVALLLKVDILWVVVLGTLVSVVMFV